MNIRQDRAYPVRYDTLQAEDVEVFYRTYAKSHA